jgi:DNA-binding transcriptional MerR regulator
MSKMTIEELAIASGTERRTIRYYVQQGVLRPPAGRNNGARYDGSHLHRLKEIKRMTEAGANLGDLKLPLLRPEFGVTPEPQKQKLPMAFRGAASTAAGPGADQPSRFFPMPGVEILITSSAVKNKAVFARNADKVNSLVASALKKCGL